jgi:hypothetical protein
MPALLAFGLLSAPVIGLEWILWRMFLRRIAGIRFPRHADVSRFRFFSIRRIRLCAIMHTLFLLGFLAFSITLTW